MVVFRYCRYMENFVPLPEILLMSNLKQRTMKKIVLFACILTAVLAGCNNGSSGGGSSPEGAVKGAIKCLHDKDYNGYVHYLPYGMRANVMTQLVRMIWTDYNAYVADEVLEIVDSKLNRIKQERDEHYIQHVRSTDPTRPDFDTKYVITRVKLRNGAEATVGWQTVFEDGKWRITGFYERNIQ